MPCRDWLPRVCGARRRVWMRGGGGGARTGHVRLPLGVRGVVSGEHGWRSGVRRSSLAAGCFLVVVRATCQTGNSKSYQPPKPPYVSVASANVRSPTCHPSPPSPPGFPSPPAAPPAPPPPSILSFSDSSLHVAACGKLLLPAPLCVAGLALCRARLHPLLMAVISPPSSQAEDQDAQDARQGQGPQILPGR